MARLFGDFRSGDWYFLCDGLQTTHHDHTPTSCQWNTMGQQGDLGKTGDGSWRLHNCIHVVHVTDLVQQLQSQQQKKGIEKDGP